MSRIPQIQIIGAGIAGLVLSRALLHRGVHSLILDRSPDFFARPRNRHGITLFPTSYHPLLPILNLDEASFRRRVAVDAEIGGEGRMSVTASGDESGDPGAGAFRANRGKLERLLAEGLEIGWEREVTEVRTGGDGGGGAEVRFADGEVWRREKGEGIVVGADGPHSIVRKAIAPMAELEVLPFAVYNGRRRYAADAFRRAFGSAFDDGNVLEAQHGEVRLQVGIDERTRDEVHLGFTYSRPARPGEDALFRPQRSKSEAKDIPEALFEEVHDLRESMDPVFQEVFHAEQMREDRMLNWLMRTLRVDTGQALYSYGSILMGDAVHAEAILGGQGANHAILDGLKLAEAIASNGTQGLREFYVDRQEAWMKSSQQSRDRIGRMHSDFRSNL